MIAVKKYDERGFTLIEMAIVLVVIGLVLGAVVKGKDVINSAKQKKFYTRYLKQWELSVASYYDRTGNLLADGTVNGGSETSKNGRFDGISSADGFARVNNALKAVGLGQVASNVGNNWQYSYAGKYSGSQKIRMSLTNRTINGRSRNVISLSNMPTDLAVAVDTMVDGEANPLTGNWRIQPAGDNTAWPDASTTIVVHADYTINLP